MATLSRAVLALLAGAGAALATPAHAVTCRLDYDVSVDTPAGTVTARGYRDGRVREGETESHEVVVTVAGIEVQRIRVYGTRSGDVGLLERHAGIDVDDVFCPAP